MQKPDAASFVVTHRKHTSRGIAMHPPMLMEPHAIYRDMNQPVPDMVNLANVTVTHGTALPDVIVSPVYAANTGAPYAAPNYMLHNSATSSSDLLIINTPFIPSKWELALKATPLFNTFSDLPTSMRFGFDMGTSSPPLYTYTPPNHKSALIFLTMSCHIFTKNSPSVVIPAPFHVRD